MLRQAEANDLQWVTVQIFSDCTVGGGKYAVTENHEEEGGGVKRRRYPTLGSIPSSRQTHLGDVHVA